MFAYFLYLVAESKSLKFDDLASLINYCVKNCLTSDDIEIYEGVKR